MRCGKIRRKPLAEKEVRDKNKWKRERKSKQESEKASEQASKQARFKMEKKENSWQSDEVRSLAGLTWSLNLGHAKIKQH